MSEFEEHKLEQETELKRRQTLLVKKIHEVFGYGAKGGLQISGASINRFDLVKEFPGATLHGSMNVSCGPHIVRLQYIRTFSRMKLPRGQEMHFHDLFPVCCFPVNIDFGRSIIRTETISDKIAELFVPCEHDFEEYRYFSWKYCCFSNDPEKLRAALNKEITELFIEHDSKIAVEFTKKHCLVKSYHSIRNIPQTLRMISFAFRLQELIT